MKNTLIVIIAVVWILSVISGYQGYQERLIYDAELVSKLDSITVRLDRMERKINVCVQDHMAAGMKYNFEVTE